MGYTGFVVPAKVVRKKFEEFKIKSEEDEIMKHLSPLISNMLDDLKAQILQHEVHVDDEDSKQSRQSLNIQSPFSTEEF